MDKKDNLPVLPKELQEARATLDKTVEELKKLKADDNDEKFGRMYEYCYQMVSNLRNYVYSVEDRMYSYTASHSAGHLPKMTPSQLEKALKMCGAGDDWNIIRPVLFASTKKGDKTLEIEFKK